MVPLGDGYEIKYLPKNAGFQVNKDGKLLILCKSYERALAHIAYDREFKKHEPREGF